MATPSLFAYLADHVVAVSKMLAVGGGLTGLVLIAFAGKRAP
jgi:hypothetical protein